jgi:hypothetical protein
VKLFENEKISKTMQGLDSRSLNTAFYKSQSMGGKKKIKDNNKSGNSKLRYLRVYLQTAMFTENGNRAYCLIRESGYS